MNEQHIMHKHLTKGILFITLRMGKTLFLTFGGSMTAPCCRIKIKLQEVDARRLELAIRGLLESPTTEIKAAFELVVTDIPPELDGEISTTMSLAEAIYLLKQDQEWHKKNPRALPSMQKLTKRAVLIRNVACFCRKPTEA